MVSIDSDNPLPPPPLVVIPGVEVYPLPFETISTESFFIVEGYRG